VIYFILNPETNNVKIGYTAGNIKSRLANIQTGNSVLLSVIATISGELQDEAVYHEKFTEYRQQGEWFYFGEKIRKFITEINNSNDNNENNDTPSLTKPTKPASFLGSFDTKWYKGLKGSEVLTMISLLSVENNKTNEIYLTKQIKIQLCEDIEICLDQFEKNIRSLIKKDMLKRISRGVYVLNPETLWIGSGKTKNKKINVYNNAQNR
jgi:hypothetical protein